MSENFASRSELDAISDLMVRVNSLSQEISVTVTVADVNGEILGYVESDPAGPRFRWGMDQDVKDA